MGTIKLTGIISQVTDEQSPKEIEDINKRRVDSIDKWSIWGYRIDFILRYVILVVIACFVYFQVKYVHKFIAAQSALNIFERLTSSSFNTVVSLGMGGTIVLVLIIGYWFGKNNSYTDSSKMVMDRFKK